MALESPARNTIMQYRTKAILVASILGIGGFLGGPRPLFAAAGGVPDTPEVVLLRAPGEGIQPQAVSDQNGLVHLVYFRGEPAAGDLYYTQIGAGKNVFNPSVRVNSQPGSAIAIGTVRGAHLALGRGGRAQVAWNGSAQASPKNSFGSFPMLHTRLDLKNHTFEPQRNVMQRTSALDGGGSIAADQAGNVYVAWHGHSEDSPIGEAGRRVWVARSSDDGATFGAEEPASDDRTGACGCCGLRALADSRGGLFILFRAATGGSDRDMHLLTSRDHGLHFEDRVIDRWRIGICPMSTAALVASPGSELAAWENQQEVHLMRIDDQPMVMTPPSASTRTGGRKHPAIAYSPRGETLLVWAEQTGWQKGGDLCWQVLDQTGMPTKVRGRVQGGVPVWGLATAVARPDGSFLIIH
jgi:hypothetical protein